METVFKTSILILLICYALAEEFPTIRSMMKKASSLAKKASKAVNSMSTPLQPEVKSAPLLSDWGCCRMCPQKFPFPPLSSKQWIQGDIKRLLGHDLPPGKEPPPFPGSTESEPDFAAQDKSVPVSKSWKIKPKENVEPRIGCCNVCKYPGKASLMAKALFLETDDKPFDEDLVKDLPPCCEFCDDQLYSAQLPPSMLSAKSRVSKGSKRASSNLFLELKDTLSQPVESRLELRPMPEPKRSVQSKKKRECCFYCESTDSNPAASTSTR